MAVGFDADDGPSFRYVKHVVAGTRRCLFETEMGGKYVKGVDIIRIDDTGKIVQFRVMVRALQALNAVPNGWGPNWRRSGPRRVPRHE